MHERDVYIETTVLSLKTENMKHTFTCSSLIHLQILCKYQEKTKPTLALVKSPLALYQKFFSVSIAEFKVSPITPLTSILCSSKQSNENLFSCKLDILTISN